MTKTLERIVLDFHGEYTEDTCPINLISFDSSSLSGKEISIQLKEDHSYKDIKTISTEQDSSATNIRKQIHINSNLSEHLIEFTMGTRSLYLISPRGEKILIPILEEKNQKLDYDAIISRIDPNKSYSTRSFARASGLGKTSVEKFRAEGLKTRKGKIISRGLRDSVIIEGKDAISFLGKRRNYYRVNELGRKLRIHPYVIDELIEEEFLETTSLGGATGLLFIPDIAILKAQIETHRFENKWRKDKYRGDNFYKFMALALNRMTPEEFSWNKVVKMFPGMGNIIYNRFDSFKEALETTSDYYMNIGNLKLARKFKRASQQVKTPGNVKRDVENVKNSGFEHISSYMSNSAEVISDFIGLPIKKVSERLSKGIHDLPSEIKRGRVIKIGGQLFYDSSMPGFNHTLLIEAARKEFGLHLTLENGQYQSLAPTRYVC